MAIFFISKNENLIFFLNTTQNIKRIKEAIKNRQANETVSGIIPS